MSVFAIIMLQPHCKSTSFPPIHNAILNVFTSYCSNELWYCTSTSTSCSASMPSKALFLVAMLMPKGSQSVQRLYMEMGVIHLITQELITSAAIKIKHLLTSQIGL